MYIIYISWLIFIKINAQITADIDLVFPFSDALLLELEATIPSQAKKDDDIPPPKVICNYCTCTYCICKEALMWTVVSSSAKIDQCQITHIDVLYEPHLE